MNYETVNAVLNGMTLVMLGVVVGILLWEGFRK